jgi:NAD(P)-dependent dehydrogenase (short-subunit alcohol dehydrogenase family)
VIGASLLDTVLDRTVLAGYTNVGYRIRRRGWGPQGTGDMRGKLVLVTGANSGLGLAAAEGFARRGAGVAILVRNRDRGQRARELIVAASGNGDVNVEVCDLGDLAAVRAFAESFNARHTRLDVLVNNAGVMMPRRELSPDGIELTFATNVVGPFLLTKLLVGALERSAPARIVNVSSGGMYTQRIDVADLQSAGGDYSPALAYARSKRAGVILSELWAQRLRGSGVVVHSMHPGWVDTPGLRTSLPGFGAVMSMLLRSPQEGADTILWLASADEPMRSSGRFWHDRRPRPTHLLPWTTESVGDRERLWAECDRLSSASATTKRSRRS